MDSISNLPLLEITAEDDSLLFDGDAATTSSASNAAATAVFSCSPLLSLRSLPRTDGRVGSLDSENVSNNATKECASFKENVNWNNKPEAPKLSVEPQQMKRKKKGGGYNLRKSLAWDRAFSTEEGVLNPLELSMISGTVTPKRINTELKAIYEEEPASASSALREIEENLFKQSSDGDAACLEDRNNGAVGLTPKSRPSIKDRVTPSLAKRKVLAVNDVVGNMSKRNAYPPRVALSSLKRPESAKAPNKESKVTKIPAPKSNVSGIKTAARSGTLSTCLPKRNQSDYPGSATNVQKYSGAKGLLKNPRTASTDPKVDMANKCSVTRTLKKQAGKHLDSIVSETRPVLHPPGTGTQKVSEACLTQGVSDTSEKKEPRQFQTTKPSGLRMPSPSLGFFSQAKPSSSQSQLQKSSKPCKLTESNIPKLRKLEMHSVNEARLPPAPRKRSELVEGVTNNCTKKLSLSGVKSEPSMQIDNIQIAGGEVECDSLDSEKINKQEIVDIKQTAGLAVECHSLGLENPSGLLHQTVWGESIQGIPYTNVEQVDESARDFGKLGGDPSAFLLNGNLSLNGDDPSRSTLEVVSLQLPRKQINTPNLSIVEEFISENENESQGNSCKLVHATTLSSKYSPEKLIPEIDSACKNEPNVAESEDCHDLVDDHDQSVVIQRRSVDEDFHQVIDSKGLYNRTQAFELDRMYVDPTTVDVTTLSSKYSPEKLIPEIDSACKTEPNVAESEDCQHLVDDHDQSVVIKRRSVNEDFHQVIEAFELDRMYVDPTTVDVTTLSSKYSPEKLIPEIDSACESEPNVAESEDCQHLVDDHDQSVVIQRRSVDEGCHQVIDSKELHNRTQAFELDRMYVDPTTVDVTSISFKCSPKKPISEMVSACENEPTVAESENWQHLLDDQSGFIKIRPLDEGCHQAIDSKVMQNRTQAFELDRMCEDSTSVHVTTYSPPKSIEEIDGACESEPKVAESEDRQQPVDCLSDFTEKRPVDERYNQEHDSEEMNNRTQAFELDRIYEDSTAVHETTLSSKCSPAKSIPELDRMCEDSTSVHVTTYSPPRSIEEIDGACESEPKVAESEDRQHLVDCLSDFIEKRPVDERYNQEPDSEGMNNRTQAFELDRIYEDSTAVHVSALSSKCSPAKSIPKINGASESENSQHPVDERYNLNIDTKVAESEDRQHPVDCLSDFIEKRSVDERYNQEPDLEGMNNRTEAFELDRIYEDSTAVNVTTLSSKCSPAKSIPEIDGACESENCQHPVDHQSDSIERRPVDERYNLNIDTEGMDNRTQALELDGKCEDSIAVSATVCSTEVNNVSPESRPFYENDIENLHFATQQYSIVKYDGDSSGDDKLICDHRTMSERQHRGDGSSMGTSVCSDVQCNVPGNYVQQTNAFSEQLRENGSSMDTSMHFDVFRDVPGHFEQQADSHTFSEINEMMCEDESLLANHGQLLEESDYSGVTVDFISNKEDSICGSESGLLQLTVLAQSVREFDHTNRESEESPVEDEQAQSFVENPVVCKYENEHCLSATNDQFLLVGDDDISDESHLSGLQRSVGGDEDSQHASSIMHLDGDGLLEITASSEEIKQKDTFEGTSEGCNIYTSENNASDHHTQSVPESTDGNLDMDAEVQCLQISDVKICCPIILPEVEVQLNHKFISAELDSSIKMTEDNSIAEIVNLNSDELCSTENLKLPASDDLSFHSSTPQGSEVSPLNNKIDSQEPEDGIEKDGFCNTDMQNQTEGDLCFEEDSSKLTDIEKSARKSKLQVPPLKLPPNAVPFSSEWLAAIEAAGEEILTIKSGAVQNSPPEKPQLEPGPWSPVKRKNQTIGPFDCTKHTNIPRSDSP